MNTTMQTEMSTAISRDDLIALNVRNIRQALKDYTAHTSHKGQLDLVSERFIETLAADSADSKAELRELLRKSSAWDEELQALVINGTKTHDPDPYKAYDIMTDIIVPYMGPVGEEFAIKCNRLCDCMEDLIRYNNTESPWLENSIAGIQEIAPHAYKPGKKLSRVFRDACVELGIADETAGSEFQRLYAKLSDELNMKKLDYKLFVSINPAHFLTMSNPKWDDRGETLISCHSLNSRAYPYNTGTIGYARDHYTMIAFTVADPDDPTSLNNRKTTRQIYAYKPGNSVLLQSRMYNTGGGCNCADELSKEYREIIEREISELENEPNLWRCPTNSADSHFIIMHDLFSGYPDWTYEHMGGKVVFRKSNDSPEPIEIGAAAICIECGNEMYDPSSLSCCADLCVCARCGDSIHEADGFEFPNGEFVCSSCLDNYYHCCICCDCIINEADTVCINGYCYCEDCANDYVETCAHCGETIQIRDTAFSSADAYDFDGNGDYICNDCVENHYFYCDCCNVVYPLGEQVEVDDERLCARCAESETFECDECGELHLRRYLLSATDANGNHVLICDDCYDQHYDRCDDCQRLVHQDSLITITNREGVTEVICQWCYQERLREALDHLDRLSLLQEYKDTQVKAIQLKIA